MAMCRVCDVIFKKDGKGCTLCSDCFYASRSKAKVKRNLYNEGLKNE